MTLTAFDEIKIGIKQMNELKVMKEINNLELRNQ